MCKHYCFKTWICNCSLQHMWHIWWHWRQSVWAWETLYNYITNYHIPIRKVKIQSNSLPWMTSSLWKEMNKRYKLLVLAQSTQKVTVKWSNYKKQRNLCTKLVRSAELAYWKNKFSNAKPAKNCGKQLSYFKAPTSPLQLGPSKIHRNYF